MMLLMGNLAGSPGGTQQRGASPCLRRFAYCSNAACTSPRMHTVVDAPPKSSTPAGAAAGRTHRHSLPLVDMTALPAGLADKHGSMYGGNNLT